MTKQIIIALVYLLLLCPTVNAEKKLDPIASFAKEMYHAWSNGDPLPHISNKIASVTDQQAAIAQRMFVHHRLKANSNVPISGFKAGLTSVAGQKKFNVSGPISGVLFASGKIDNGGTVSLADYRKLMLETEIGFVLGQDIDTPVKNIQQLKNKVSGILPVIEMPDLALADLKKITGQDIVASNAIASQYLLGTAINMPVSFSLNKIKTSFVHSVESNNTSVNQGSGNDALGDQWQALLWIVNERLASGHHLRKGQFLITGALGKMIPAQVGVYQADFGALGQLTFTVTE